MAEPKILQNLIPGLGQSQADRLPPELGRHFVDIDERDARALLEQSAALAQHLRFYARSPRAASGDWTAYFPRGEEAAGLLARDDGEVPPHLGLLVAFLRLYRHP